MRKLLAFIAIAMAFICAKAATPSYENFDPAYFVRSGNTLRVNITNISGPTNGITSSTATNIAAYQAQIATNKLNTDFTSLINSTSNSITAATTNFVTGTSNGLYSLIGSGGLDVPTVVAIMSSNNAATADFSKTSPIQLPSSLFKSWNSGTLLLTNGNSIQDSNSLAEASIGNIGTTEALYYISYDGGYTGRIWGAYGSLLNGFTKHGIILAPTAASWDASSIGGVTHYREGVTNYLYYFGGNNAAGFEVDPLSIGVAYSTDGTNYTKYSGNPIMRSNNVAASCVTCYTWFTKKTATGYLGFFNAKHNSGATERIHLAAANNPLGPWTYVGEIFHHTNASVTSDFTVADLPSGGYIAAYWINTNGSFQSSFAYSTDLTNWIPKGTGPAGTFVGGRFFYDDGLAYSYCISVPGNAGSVYYTRPKKSDLGSIVAQTVVSTAGFNGNGAGVSNVQATTALTLKSSYYSGGNVLEGSFDDVDTWSISWNGANQYPTNNYDLSYNSSADRWLSRGAWSLGDGFFVTNSVIGTNIAVISSLGSRVSGVGLTNGILSGNASGLTNASPAIATNNASATDGMALVKRGNNLSLETITGSGGTNGSPTTISNNYFVAASSTATYTNSTAYWLYVSAELYQSASVVSLAKAQFMVDTNVNGTLDKFREYWWQIGDDNVHYQSSGWVPPGASYQWTNTFGNVALFNFAIQQTYLIEGSGGGGSSGTFNATQFGSSAAGTNIVAGALVTNVVNRISDETIILKDDAGNSLMSWDSDNTDLHFFANVIVDNGGFAGHGGNLTNLNASSLSSGTVNRPVTNSVIQTGDLYVTNNISVDGTFNVATVNTTNFTVTNPWNASNATNLQATNILSRFSMGQIAGGFGGNSFWLGQNAVLISENFHSSVTDPRLAVSVAQGGSGGLLGFVSGMNGIERLGSYPTNTGSYSTLRFMNSGTMYYSNRLSMDVGFQVIGYELTEHVVGAVNSTTALAATDAIRWVANTNWSANWIANCMSNSVSTFVTSSVPVTLSSVIRLSIDSDTTSARFYTNGVIATTISSNVPVGRSIIPLIRGMATANTGASTIQYNYSDYWWLIFY